MDARLGEAVAGALESNLAELLRQRLCQTIYVPAPAAGADWTFTVPNVAFWELLSVSEILTTSAVVANRRTAVRVDDPNGVRLAQVDAVAVQAASLAVGYVYERDVAFPQAAIVNTAAVPGAEVPLWPGSKIRAQTQNLDVGDAHSAIVLQIREWSFEEIVRQAQWLERHLPSGLE